METTKAERIRLGIFMLVGMIIIFAIGFFYVGKNFTERKVVYYTKFSESVSGLNIGAKVRWSGVNIGQVVRIDIDEKSLEQVVVYFEVPAGTPIKPSMKVNLSGGINITGLKSLELTGGSPQEPNLPPNSEVEAGHSQLKQITGQAEVIVYKAETLVNNLVGLTDDANQANFANTLQHLNSLVIKLDQLVSSNYDNVDVVFQQITSAVHNLNQASLGAQKAVVILQNDLQQMNLAAKMDTIVAGVQQTLHAFEKSGNAINQKVNALDLNTALDGVNQATKGIETTAKRADLLLYRSQEDFGLAVQRLKETADNLADFSRQIKETPSILLRGEDKQGRDR